MAARGWLCRCGYRNEPGHRKCRGPECSRSKPRRRRPAHLQALDLSFEDYAELNVRVHGVGSDTCALCKGPRKMDGPRLDRDHAHFDGGYPRGLTHNLCNKILGQVERGRDGEAWLEFALAYVRRAKRAHSSGFVLTETLDDETSEAA